jgi:hypothetical protein
MPVLSVYVSDECLERLQWFAREQDPQHRSVEDLAEAAIDVAAISADSRPRDWVETEARR